MTMENNIEPTDIKSLIIHIRGKAVMLDSDLARLYQVSTSRLNEAVKRNLKRFPDDFMFLLTKSEYENLISQFATSSSHGGRRKLPLVFTEQGIAMLSGVLNSDVAIQTNIHIMRAFVQIRRLGLTVVDLKRKIDNMERTYDHQFKIVFDTMRELLEPPPVSIKKRKMGFTADK